MLFFGIKKTVRLNKKKTKEFPLGNSLVHTVIVCSLWLGAPGWTCLAFFGSALKTGLLQFTIFQSG